jgi:hypothetical protein
MDIRFAEVKVGDPICHDGLAVFPLFAEGDSRLEYRLSDEAIAEGAVSVEEGSTILSVRPGPDLGGGSSTTKDPRRRFWNRRDGRHLFGPRQEAG